MHVYGCPSYLINNMRVNQASIQSRATIGPPTADRPVVVQFYMLTGKFDRDDPDTLKKISK